MPNDRFDASTIAVNHVVPMFWRNDHPQEAETIKNLWIPKTIKEIGAFAFSGCPNLETVECEESDRRLELSMRSFADCPNLSSVLLRTQESTLCLNSTFQNCPALNDNISYRESHQRALRTFPLLDNLREVMPIREFSANRDRIVDAVQALFKKVSTEPAFEMDTLATGFEEALQYFENNWNRPDRVMDFFQSEFADRIAGHGQAQLQLTEERRKRIEEQSREFVSLYSDIRNATEITDREANRYFELMGYHAHLYFHRTVAILRPDRFAAWADAPSLDALYAWLHGDERDGNTCDRNWVRMSESVWNQMKTCLPEASRGQLNIFVHRLAEAFEGRNPDRSNLIRQVLAEKRLIP